VLRKPIPPTGFVRDTDSNSVWDMQFIWPFKVEYRIVHINDDYTQTIIGRNKRDYVWIMARTPALTETEYRGLVRIVAERGYDTDLLRPVPQRC
jgi:apolipoprotein D and lipocalin family protein